MDKWTFPELEYKRPDVDEVRNIITKHTEAVRNAKSGDDVLDAIFSLDRTMSPVMDMGTLASVRNTLDTTDEFYDKENEYISQMMPTITPDIVAFSSAVEESPFRKSVEERFGHQYFVRTELQRKSFCEENIPLMQKEALLTNEYQKIMAGCQIEFEGQTLNLYGIQKYFENENRELRKKAWRAYSAFYQSNEERLEEIWSELIEIRNQMGRNLGYENYIPLGYMNQGRTDYGAEEVAAFREQVRQEIVPLCEKLYEAQARRLGIDRTYCYDEGRIFPDGNATPAGDDDFMIEKAREMYHDISPETAEFIDFMIDHKLMDLKNRPGKASTGYCTILASRKAPFVFSCFNQTKFDMEVLSHELGHAFAFFRSLRSQELTDFAEVTTDIAEIHSMSMEQFAYPYAEGFFGKDADKYRFAHLQDAVTFVPFGVAVDEFQHICYSKPELTPKERTYEWHKLEEKYMPWRKYDGDEFLERGGWWYHKLHIYLYPFYYINYTLTTMGALEFKKKNIEDRENAWKDYLALCDIGGRLSYLKTLELAHLSNPFEKGSVARIVGPAKTILERDMNL